MQVRLCSLQSERASAGQVESAPPKLGEGGVILHQFKRRKKPHFNAKVNEN